MRVLISIPKEFEQHFKQDAFEDSLLRLSEDAHLLAGNYEQETAVMLIEAFKNAVPVPPYGRLIDADALVAEFHRLTLGENSLIEKFFADGVYAVIDNAPTIIPAEEGE